MGGPLTSATPAAARSGGRGRALVILLLTAVAVFGADHLVKWLVVSHIALHDQVPAGGPITIHHIENEGAAFGLFAQPQMQGVFVAVAVLVSGYILLAGHRFGTGPLVQVPLGLILGGACANAVDRFAQGYVVDYIDLHRWPVFNLADMAIVVGIAVCLVVLPTRSAGEHEASPR